MDAKKVRRLSDQDVQVIKFVAENPYTDAKAITQHLGNKSSNYNQLNKLAKQGFLEDHRDHFFRRYFSLAEGIDLVEIDNIVEDEKRRIERWRQEYENCMKEVEAEREADQEDDLVIYPEFSPQVEFLRQDADLKDSIRGLTADIQGMRIREGLNTNKQARFNDRVESRLLELEKFAESRAEIDELRDRINQLVDSRILELESEVKALSKLFNANSFDRLEAQKPQILAAENTLGPLSIELRKLDQLAKERSDGLERMEENMMRLYQSMLQFSRLPAPPAKIPEFNESWPDAVKVKWFETVSALINKS